MHRDRSKLLNWHFHMLRYCKRGGAQERWSLWNSSRPTSCIPRVRLSWASLKHILKNGHKIMANQDVPWVYLCICRSDTDVWKNPSSNTVTDILILKYKTLLCHFHVSVTAVWRTIHHSNNTWTTVVLWSDIDQWWIGWSVIWYDNRYTVVCNYSEPAI